MEKKHKIIIIVLIIAIIALSASLAFILKNNSSDGGVPNGMKVYDFNSEFTMNVPKDTKFLKSWNNSGDQLFGQGYTYLDKNNEFFVAYAVSPLITHEVVNAFVEISNSSGNATVNVDGDLIIVHNKKANGKVGSTVDKSNFTETILIQRGHQLVGVGGNDLNFLKTMVNTIEFYE
ncbi:hypothetical protein [uncultured Methanobrevibacter sp.]|uniref:hypothetical protein n=1 Tax=uncultured Methanobrevibacter sp. TaxID=253161 RepID=UPI0025E287FF|nr:hypothetical protein [uncultured Methanobrevibacter sp.]